MKIEPKEVDRVMMAFPANVIGDYLPKMEDIPEEYTKGWTSNSACQFASKLMMGGLPEGKLGFAPVDGIDPNMAWRHINACLGSYQPKHEHKIAGVGYLISLWVKIFLINDDVIWENEDLAAAEEE